MSSISFSFAVFEPEVTHAMSRAFDEVCQALGVSETSRDEREAVASKIIVFARYGERDADRLRDRVLRDMEPR